MEKQYLEGSINPRNLFDTINYRAQFAKDNPDYFYPEGLLCFCGGQGSGKSLSAVQYVLKLIEAYPKSILVTNVDIFTLPEGYKVIEYDGIDCLTSVSNGIYGVIYFIDEIHLEFNSLESKNIPIEVMVEVSQQRKQRKHIVCTSQVYMRMAKPLREQIHSVVLCRSFFKCFQVNKLIDGTTSSENNGKLVADVKGHYVWFHSPKLYNNYDTFAKMRRYRNEWKGVPRTDIYEKVKES